MRSSRWGWPWQPASAGQVLWNNERLVFYLSTLYPEDSVSTNKCEIFSKHVTAWNSFPSFISLCYYLSVNDFHQQLIQLNFSLGQGLPSSNYILRTIRYYKNSRVSCDKYIRQHVTATRHRRKIEPAENRKNYFLLKTNLFSCPCCASRVISAETVSQLIIFMYISNIDVSDSNVSNELPVSGYYSRFV